MPRLGLIPSPSRPEPMSEGPTICSKGANAEPLRFQRIPGAKRDFASVIEAEHLVIHGRSHWMGSPGSSSRTRRRMEGNGLLGSAAPTSNVIDGRKRVSRRGQIESSVRAEGRDMLNHQKFDRGPARFESKAQLLAQCREDRLIRGSRRKGRV